MDPGLSPRRGDVLISDPIVSETRALLAGGGGAAGGAPTHRRGRGAGKACTSLSFLAVGQFYYASLFLRGMKVVNHYIFHHGIHWIQHGSRLVQSESAAL